MPSPVPSLVLLALPGAALFALEIKDNNTSLSLGLYAQVVAAKAVANDAAGDSYNATEGMAGRGDDADFYLRRFRPSFKGTHDGFLFQATLAADNAGRVTSVAGSGATTVTLFEGYVGKVFKGEHVTQTVTAGKQIPWFNPASGRSSTQQFVASRASAEYLAPCGVGVGYRLAAPWISLGVDLQNNTGDDTANQTGTNHGEGTCAMARIEITGPTVDQWAIGKWQESFAGAAGKGVALGFEAGTNQRDRTSATASTTTTALGSDLLVHVDGLTALAEYRHQAKTVMPDAAANDATGAEVIVVQAGYAVAWSAVGVLEPALRYQRIDSDTANDAEGKAYGWKDYGDSGREFDTELNLYLSGHSNKFGLICTVWKGEETAVGTPRATIVRLQHQLLF